MVKLDTVFTAEGSPNMAYIKYWGKRDEKLILPWNSSLSMTLSRDVLHTTTSIMFSERLKEDAIYIDGKKQDLSDKDVQERFGMINILRKMSKTSAKVLIVSKNDFPAASGLASSASGIATLAYVANAALQLKLTPTELSKIARQGSGSACRSIFGGIVRWNKGVKSDGSDSDAEQIFDERYWPEIIDVISIVSQEKKKTSSRAGMKQTVATNPLFKSRPASAEKRVDLAIQAYKEHDFNALAEQIMADSNEMHALMLSTCPSIRYLNPTSFAIMDAIEELNAAASKNIAAYTFDAGPNSNIITLKEHKETVLKVLKPLIASKAIMDVKISEVGSGPKLLDSNSYSLIDSKKLSPKVL